MKIVLLPNNTLCNEQCWICGELFPAGEILPTLEGERNTYVCGACIAAGPDGMKERAKQWAVRLAEAAAQAKKFADDLALAVIHAPSTVQVEEALERHLKEMDHRAVRMAVGGGVGGLAAWMRNNPKP